MKHELKKRYKCFDKEARAYPIEMLDENTPCFLENPAINWILDNADTFNALWIARQNQKWPLRHMRQLYRMMGYTYEDYFEVFHWFLNEKEEFE